MREQSVITGTGSYIPPVIKTNSDFFGGEFYADSRRLIEQPAQQVVEKFRQITGIEERRYAPCNMNASEMGMYAARMAIEESGIDPETLDQVIVAHNYGDVVPDSLQPDTVPALASRVKHQLGIRNPSCVAYDILFGCPGWLQGLIQADIFLKAGVAGKCLVIGTETLSRIIDKHDRDSMIFSDGAGACIIEKIDTEENGPGVLGSSTRSDCVDEVSYINFGSSYAPHNGQPTRYIKMNGRKVYEYAIKYVPEAMKACMDKSGVEIGQLKKIFIHQANEKMDEGIINAFYRLYNIQKAPGGVMPMSIHKLGNSSVATIPTLYDLVRKGKISNQSLQEGDVLMFASVGAGMNINAVCYRY